MKTDVKTDVKTYVNTDVKTYVKTDVKKDVKTNVCVFGGETLQRALVVARLSGHSSVEDRADFALEGLRSSIVQRWHFQMVNDVPRAEQYSNAIRATLQRMREKRRAAGKPDDDFVALDILAVLVDTVCQKLIFLKNVCSSKIAIFVSNLRLVKD